MAANPFLFTEDEYTSPAAASNPFLIGDEDIGTSGDNENPFLSQTATSVASSAYTNPFAFEPMDLEPSEAELPNFASNEPVNNCFINATTTSVGSADFFSTTDQVSYTTTTTTTNNQDFFINTTSVNSVSAPQKPTELELKYTNTTSAENNHDIKNGGPPRPPPPRPPPSKETQDLLMSVMGAMDATSSHLLDRIPPTRTPSPVSMRDLHSPSPTPEPAFGDLLDVGDNKLIETNSSSMEDLMSQEPSCDVNQNPPIPQAAPIIPPQPAPIIPPQPAPIIPPQPVVPPARPGPPVRPPRPQPPQKPPPPAFNAAPPPPVQQIAQPAAQNDMVDMFGPPQKTIASKDDILNLYNKPKEETKTDLLFDAIGDENFSNSSEIIKDTSSNAIISKPVEVQEVQPSQIINESNTDSAPSFFTAQPQEEATVQDNFISPEPSQNDLQMDTSDSQSKGSVSSVTFNPFAATDDGNFSTSKEPELLPVDSTLENNVFQPAEVIDNANFNTTSTVTSTITDPFANTINTTVTTNMTYNNAFDIGGITHENKPKDNDAFDAFTQKFESVKDENKNGAFDAFGGGGDDPWGAEFGGINESVSGFDNEEPFDTFLSLQEPPGVPQSTPNRISKSGSQDSDEDKDFSVFIRPKTNEECDTGILPTIAPPPVPLQSAFTDTSPRFNPFDQQNDVSAIPAPQAEPIIPYGGGEMKRTDSQETPPTPLFDDDVSQPLQPFPRMNFAAEGWEMHLRQPNKKKITGQRFWKKIFVKLVHQPDCVLLQLYNQENDKDPFQELPLQPCYSVSDIGAQQYDQFGKIFTVKLQYIFYKERPGVRPGQVKKAERITNKLSQFAAYAIQGDYQGVKEFGSDLKKLGLPVEHAPQVSQLMKLGSLNYEDLKQFSFCIEEALFKLQAHRDRALHYKMEEVQITAVDELYVEQDSEGHIERQIARVRLFFLGFLTGMPDIELGINDMRRQGKEVVGRHDIIPVVTEEWIRLEDVEFHSCVQPEEYFNTHIIKFKPPDACYIELMRFRVRPPKNRELPLQLKAQIIITGTRVELRADVLVPGFASRKLGQIPCEDVMIRFPIPECWIYLFRVEKHFRYGSVKSAHRRTGKIKGIERILGTMETLQENLIEVTSGQAKYEHQHRAIVWRCPRLPKEGQGAYTTHNMVCHIALTSYDQMPEKLAEYCYVEFTMPATQVSHTTCRSVSLQNSDSDEPPEKYVRYLARHEYRVGIEHSEGESPNAYASATFVKKPAAPEEVKNEKPAPVAEESSSDSD